MPHLKVKPFDSSKIDTKIQTCRMITLHARSLSSTDELIGIKHNDEEFLLQVKPGKEETLVKYDKVTRPLKVNLIKEALDIVSKELALDIVSSNISLSSTKVLWSSKYFKKIKDFENIIYPKNKLSVEVGFGSGKHLLYQAQQNPDTLFIGIEIHTPSAQQVLKQISLQNLDNIWVVNYDARLFLEMLPSNSCHQIFVHFPIPWDKKPQRRVISKPFVAEAMRVLSVGGRLELRTDSDNYFWYALKTFFSVPKVTVDVRKNEALQVISKYEARWKRQEKDIYDVYVNADIVSEDKILLVDFNFNIVKYKHGMELKIPKEAFVSDEYFIHFERCYKTDDERLLIKCAFGSFDRPEHKYIILDKTSCRYFVSPPVKTRINYKAHKKIMELLDV